MSSQILVSRKRSRNEVFGPKKQQRTKDSPGADPLHTVGYRLHRSVFTISDTLLEGVKKRAKNATPIFNQNESRRNDQKRCQGSLSITRNRKEVREFLLSVNKFLQENVSRALKPAPWVVIHSKPDCQDQAAHCDYVPDEALANASDEKTPLSVIVSLMPGTRLNVWPNSIRLATASPDLYSRVKPISCEVVELGVGDVLVFRGDFVHAGSCYEKDNYRLHTFLDSDKVPRKPNRTWIIHTHGNKEIQKIIQPKS